MKLNEADKELKKPYPTNVRIPCSSVSANIFATGSLSNINYNGIRALHSQIGKCTPVQMSFSVQKVNVALIRRRHILRESNQRH